MRGRTTLSNPEANDGRLVRRIRFCWDSPVRKFIWDSLLRVPWLIAYNIAGTAVLAILFAFTSRGRICCASRPSVVSCSPISIGDDARTGALVGCRGECFVEGNA